MGAALATRPVRSLLAVSYNEQRRQAIAERKAAGAGLEGLLTAIWRCLCDDLAEGTKIVPNRDMSAIFRPGLRAYRYIMSDDFVWLVSISDLSLDADEMRALLIARCPDPCWRDPPYRDWTVSW